MWKFKKLLVQSEFFVYLSPSANKPGNIKYNMVKDITRTISIMISKGGQISILFFAIFVLKF